MTMKKTFPDWILKFYQYIINLSVILLVCVKENIVTSKHEFYHRVMKYRKHFINLKDLLILLVSWMRSVFYKSTNCPIDRRNGFSTCGMLSPVSFPHKFGISPIEWSIQSRTILVYFGGESGSSKQQPQDKEDEQESAKQTEDEMEKHGATASDQHCATSRNEKGACSFVSVPEEREPAHSVKDADCKSRKRKKKSSNSENKMSSEANKVARSQPQLISRLGQPSNTLPPLYLSVESHNEPIFHVANPLIKGCTFTCKQDFRNIFEDCDNLPRDCRTSNSQLHNANCATAVLDETKEGTDKNEEESVIGASKSKNAQKSTKYTESCEDETGTSIRKNNPSRNKPQENKEKSDLDYQPRIPSSNSAVNAQSRPSVCRQADTIQTMEVERSAAISPTTSSRLLPDVKNSSNRHHSSSLKSLESENEEPVDVNSEIGDFEPDVSDEMLHSLFSFPVSGASLPECGSMSIPMRPAISILHNIINMRPVLYKDNDICIRPPDLRRFRRLQGDNADIIHRLRRISRGYPFLYFLNLGDTDPNGALFRILITPIRNFWPTNDRAYLNVEHWGCFRGDSCDRQPTFPDIHEFYNRLVLVSVSRLTYQSIRIPGHSSPNQDNRLCTTSSNTESSEKEQPNHRDRYKHCSAADSAHLCARNEMRSSLKEKDTAERSSTSHGNCSQMTPTENTNHPLQLHPSSGSNIQFALTSNESQIPFYITLSSDGVMSLNIYKHFCDIKGSRNKKPDLSTIPAFTMVANWAYRTVEVYKSFGSQQSEDEPITNETDEQEKEVINKETMNLCNKKLNQRYSLKHNQSDANKVHKSETSGLRSKKPKLKDEECGHSESADRGNMSNTSINANHPQESIQTFQNIFSVSRDNILNRLSAACGNENSLPTLNKSSHNMKTNEGSSSLNKNSASESDASLSIECLGFADREKSVKRHCSITSTHEASCSERTSEDIHGENFNSSEEMGFRSSSRDVSKNKKPDLSTIPVFTLATNWTYQTVKMYRSLLSRQSKDGTISPDGPKTQTSSKKVSNSIAASSRQCLPTLPRLYHEAKNDWPNISGNSMEYRQFATRGFVTVFTSGESTLFSFSDSINSVQSEFVVLIDYSLPSINLYFRVTSNFQYQIPRNVYLDLTVTRVVREEPPPGPIKFIFNLRRHQMSMSAVSNNFDCSHYSDISGASIYCDHKEIVVAFREETSNENPDKTQNKNTAANQFAWTYASTSKNAKSPKSGSDENVLIDRVASLNSFVQRSLPATPRTRVKCGKDIEDYLNESNHIPDGSPLKSWQNSEVIRSIPSVVTNISASSVNTAQSKTSTSGIIKDDSLDSIEDEQNIYFNLPQLCSRNEIHYRTRHTRPVITFKFLGDRSYHELISDILARHPKALQLTM